MIPNIATGGSNYEDLDTDGNVSSHLNGTSIPSTSTIIGPNGIDPATFIDPPEGFQPDKDQDFSASTKSNTVPRVSHRNSVSQSGGSSRSSGMTSLSETARQPNHNSLTNGQTNGRFVQTIDRGTFHHSNQSPSSSSSNNNDEVNGQLTAAGSSSGPMNNESIQASASETQQTAHSLHSTHKEHPIPSTSSPYPKLINGFSNVVNRITRAFANTSLSMISTDSCIQDDDPKFTFGHKRSLEKTWKLMDRVVKCCQKPGMNLNNSPPFILEILPETYQHLKLIHTKYSSDSKFPTNDNQYSQVFLRNLQARCEQTLKLFKDAREDMFNEESEHRHKLTRHTLVFNHMLSELKAVFPNGRFIGERYLITKKETAGEFWKSNFGFSVLVDWRTFYHALRAVHNIDSSFFSLNALKQTIDLTCDDYISIFEFDVFTRLFQPWSTLLSNWRILAVTHPGYKAFLTYDELKARLQRHIDKPGSYVFRLSCTRLGQWAIGYVTPDRQILQTIVQNISLSQALAETKFYLYPDGNDEDPNLKLLCSEMTGDERNVTVTEEQYEIYCGVGNSFQTCKICFENDKDIRLEPCNHLLCTSCLISWQESDGQGCPYCRTEIKDTVQIAMDLPKSRRNKS